MKEGETRLLARIEERTSNLSARLERIDKRLEAHYVTNQEFAPVKRIVYGAMGLVLATVFGGLLALVIRI